MAGNKPEILNEAASVIEENAISLRDSHFNPKTEKVEPKSVREQVRRELWIASKLREYYNFK